MKKLTLQQFNELIKDTKTIKGTPNWPKVLLTPDHLVLKLIYKRKKLFSTSFVYPYAYRFARQSKKLQAKGVVAPVVKDIYHCPEKNCHIVTYPLIDGESLDKLIMDPTPVLSEAEGVKPRDDNDKKSRDYNDKESRDNLSPLDLLIKFARFVAELHDKGIFFWDLHLGNIMITPECKFALLDITSVKIYRNPLSIKKRARNLARFIRIEKKNNNLFQDERQLEKFIANYCRIANIIEEEISILKNR